MSRDFKLLAAFAIVVSFAKVADAQDNDLAQQLANPIAAIISVPFQLNYDDNIGVADTGQRTTLNFQPVVPFALDTGANIVTRTIIPYVWQKDIVPDTSQEGFGDILFSAWYSRTTSGGLTWGVGPVIRIPTRSSVSTYTWAAGLTGIALKVSGPWTYGALASHISDLESAPTTPTNATFIQPFASYTTPNAWTFSVTSEMTYDWLSEQWSTPVNVSAAKLTRVGKVPVSWSAGIGYWVESPVGGPEGVRFRVQAQLVFPR